MANYSDIRQTIDTNIKQNNNNEITGNILNAVLKGMIDAFGACYMFNGIASPGSVVGTPDQNCFWVITQGSYNNFGDLTITIPAGSLGFVTYNGSFSVSILDLGAVVASRLQTPRTLWGQSFDGTADVSGALDDVEEIRHNDNFVNLLTPISVYNALSSHLFTIGSHSDTAVGTFDANGLRMYIPKIMFRENNQWKDILSLTNSVLKVNNAISIADNGDLSGVTSLAMDGVLSGARGEIDAIPRNQIKNSDFRIGLPSGWNGSGATAIFDDAQKAVCLTKTGGNYDLRTDSNNTSYIQGHKYICMAKAKGDEGTYANVYDYNVVGYTGLNVMPLSSLYRVIYVISQANTSAQNTFLINGNYEGASIGMRIWVKWTQCIDLTAMFGAGNEPTTANEFARRLGYASIDDVPYIPYTATPIPLNDAMAVGGDLVVRERIAPLKGMLQIAGRMAGLKGAVKSIEQTATRLKSGVGWDVYDSAISSVAYTSDFIANVTVSAAQQPPSWALRNTNPDLIIPNGGTILVIIDIKATTSATFNLSVGGVGNIIGFGTIGTNWTRITATWTNNTGSDVSGFYIFPATQTNYSVRNAMIIGINEMFDGETPTTADGFAQAMGYNGVSEIPYIPFTTIPSTVNDALPIAKDLLIGGEIAYLQGLRIKYNSATNTVTFCDADGNPSKIIYDQT